MRPTAALAAVYDVVVRANRYMVERSPWTMAKDPARRDELGSVLYASAETLRALTICFMSCPARPRDCGSSSASRKPSSRSGSHAGAWGQMVPGTKTTKGEVFSPGSTPRTEPLGAPPGKPADVSRESPWMHPKLRPPIIARRWADPTLNSRCRGGWWTPTATCSLRTGNLHSWSRLPAMPASIGSSASAWTPRPRPDRSRSPNR